MTALSKNRQEKEQEEGKSGGDGGKIERKLSEVNIRDVSRGQNELIGEFKIAMGYVISIRGQVIKYLYILTGIKRQLVRFGVYWNWKG